MTQPDAYTAALEGAALFDENDSGRIRMRGEHAADLLHRLSTNDMKQLQPGQGARTVLTTPIGRIIDLLTVYVQDDSLIAVSGTGQGGAVFSHLRKNIFFNDKVTLEPLGRSHGQFALYGPHAAALLSELGGTHIGDLALHSSVRVSIASHEVVIARALPLGGAGFRLLVPTEGADAVHTALLDAGAATLDAATGNVLRVEAGYPAVGHELSQDYIPLETDLDDAISFTKGCYVGQEIIARMESRGRRAKALRGLRFAPDEVLSAPAKLEVDTKDAGDLTSVVVSPRFGQIGLAYVRSAHLAADASLGVSGTGVVGKVVGLPFVVRER